MARFPLPVRRIAGWLRKRLHGRDLVEADLVEAVRRIDALDYARGFALLDGHGGTRKLRRRVARERVILLERTGDLTAARKAAQARLAEDPADAGALADAARLALAVGDAPAAIAVPRSPVRADTPLLRLAAERAMAEGRHGDAVEAAAAAYALTGSAGDAARHVAMMLVAGDAAAAEGLARDHATRFPTSARFPIRLAQFAERRRDWGAALRHFDDVIAREPGSLVGRSGKARALAYLGRHDDALAWIVEARGGGDAGLWGDGMAAFVHARRGDAAAARIALATLYAAGARHRVEDARGRAADPRDVWLGDRRHVAHPSAHAVRNGEHFARFVAALERSAATMLVGNAPMLLGAGHGSAIDAQDVIIRLNDFVTAGFEADVGGRTDWWLCSAAKQARPDRASVAGTSALIVQPHAQHYPDPDAFVQGRLGLEPGLIRAGFLPPWLHRLGGVLPYPTKTMGFRSIMMLEFLIQRPFRAVGFDFFAGPDMHYFANDAARLRVSEIHAIDFERDFVSAVLVPFARYGRFGGP